MTAYYNEIDKHAAAWLRNLIAAGHIAPGDVDERSITEVSADDLRGYTQCHFFAGIGGWSYALRLAGWPDDRPVWTGSCPCQPFSSAGKQRGSEDERHLWPAFFDLIRQCGPRVVIGEQVAGAAGYAWWDHVAADLEGEGYAAAAADIGAHSVGAPHLRQRLYWVAHAENRVQQRDAREERSSQRGHEGQEPVAWQSGTRFVDGGSVGPVAHAEQRPAERQRLDMAGAARGDEAEARQRQRVRDESGDGGDAGPVGNAGNEGLEIERRFPGVSRGASGAGAGQAVERTGGMVYAAGAGREAERQARALKGGDEYQLGPWADLAWIECSDGKARPTQPGLFPLAHGISGRVGRLRAYGNAIVPQVAAAFITAAT